MSVKNPNVLSFMAHYEALKTANKNPAKYSHLTSKPTQIESQKRRYFEKVIVALDENGKSNTTQIIQLTGLSSKSVCNTLRFFRERKIVSMHTRKDKQNNEKIYSLNRLDAIIYLAKFSLGEFLKSYKNAEKQAMEISMKTRSRRYAYAVLEYTDEFVTDEIRNKEIILPQKYQARLEGKKTTWLTDLPIDIFEEIVMSYHTKKYCIPCWKKGMLSNLLIQHDIRYCRDCGEHPDNQDNDEVWLKSKVRYWRDKKYKYNFDERFLKKLNPSYEKTSHHELV